MNDPVKTFASDDAKGSETTAYEPPRIEKALSAEEMEREVLFAGIPFSFAGGAAPRVRRRGRP